jgi:hypothetical protein
VTVRKVSNGLIAATAVSDANGLYTAAGLKPGDYTVFAVKVGYAFPAPAPATVGPDGTVDINSDSPVLRAVKPHQIKKNPAGPINIPSVN